MCLAFRSSHNFRYCYKKDEMPSSLIQIAYSLNEFSKSAKQILNLEFLDILKNTAA